MLGARLSVLLALFLGHRIARARAAGAAAPVPAAQPGRFPISSGVLWAAAMFAWFFISALYLQLVLGYDADAGRAWPSCRPT